MNIPLPSTSPGQPLSWRDFIRPYIRSKLVWALRVRFILALAVWVVVMVGARYSGFFPGGQAMLVAVILVAIGHVVARLLESRSPPAIWFGLSIGDSFILAGLLLYFGGINSPLLPLFLIQLFAAALLAGPRAVVALAALDGVLLVTVGLSELAGWWQPWPTALGVELGPPSEETDSVIHLVLWGIYLAVGALLTASAGHLVRRVEQEGLARSNRELAAVRVMNRAVSLEEERPLRDVVVMILEATKGALDLSLAVLLAPDTAEGPLQLYATAEDRESFLRLLETGETQGEGGAVALPPFPQLRRQAREWIGDEPFMVVREVGEALAALGFSPTGPGDVRWRGSSGNLYLLVPLRAEGTVNGLLVLSIAGPALHPSDVESLRLVAHELARTVHLAHLRHARSGLTAVLRQRNTQLERILGLNNELQLDLPLEELQQRVVEAIRETLDIDKVILSLVGEGEELVTAAWSGRARLEPPPMTTSINVALLRPGNRISRSYLLRGRDTGATVRPGDPWGADDRLIVRVEARGQFLGYLSLGAPSSGKIPPQRVIEVIEIMAGQIGLAIQNARWYQSLVEERTRLNAILESSVEPIIALDGQQVIRLMNKAAEAALLVQPAQVVGRDLSLAGFPRPLRDAIQKACAGGEPVTREVELGDGRTFVMSAAPLPNHLADGSAGSVVTLHDVSHLKALDRLKSEFVNTVSHDLRAPLTTIATYVFLLESEQGLSEAARDGLNQIDAAVTRMTRLITDLLDLGRIESGVGFQRKSFDLGELLVNIQREAQPLADAKGLRLVLRAIRNLPPIEGDPDRLHQAVANLVYNAIKFTPPGGEVAIQAERTAARVIVSVSDTGVGIPLADQPYIFDKFYRVARRPGDDTPITGTGLGLAIVKGIVEHHGGKVTVESQPRAGTTFRVMLPVDEPATPSQVQD